MRQAGLKLLKGSGSRISGLFFLFFLLHIPWLCYSQSKDSSVAVRPDIVLIVSCGHGVHDLGCYGSQCIKTPNLDRLAGEGLRMTQAYSSSASVSACYASLLTGCMGHTTGQYGEAEGFSHFSLFPEIRTLSGYLSKAGYRTARIGAFPLQPDTNFHYDTVLGENINDRSSYEMADQCVHFITENDTQPFFLLFSLADPSRSNVPMDQSSYGADRFGNRKEGYRDILPEKYKLRRMELPAYLTDNPGGREEYAQYAQAISRLDMGVGRLFYHLRKLGLWNKTLIIYVSATGPEFPGVSGNLYETNTHIPLIVKPPHLKDHVTCNAMISGIDLAPTILDIAGVLPAENNFQGRSFRNIMRDGSPRGWGEVFMSHTFNGILAYYPMRAIRTRHYELIQNLAWQLPFPFSTRMQASATWHGILASGNDTLAGITFHDYFHRPPFELYDLKSDPLEHHNVADDPKYTDILQSLQSRLLNFRLVTHDPWVINENPVLLQTPGHMK